MNKEMAWILGYLLSDGCITKPTYRKKGDERHLQFICKYEDKEILNKVKNILNTKAIVKEYPTYSSPHTKLRVYDRKDIIEEYSDIKTKIPKDKIKGYERHFIRGLFDGDGTLSVRKRNNIFRIGFVNEYKNIVDWVIETIRCNTYIPDKQCRFVKQNNVWEVIWEGNIARIIAFWLYHGDINNCCLKRKLDKYKLSVLDNNIFESIEDEILYAAKAKKEDNWIKFNVPSNNTLKWCHIIQKLMPYNTIPVFKNPGKRKYYNLYIPTKEKNKQIANTQDT